MGCDVLRERARATTLGHLKRPRMGCRRLGVRGAGETRWPVSQVVPIAQ